MGGTCLWETLTRLIPYDGVHTNCVQLRVANDASHYTPEVAAIEQKLFTKYDEDSPPGQFLKTIRECWAKNPSLRPPCDTILGQLRSLHFPNYNLDDQGVSSHALSNSRLSSRALSNASSDDQAFVQGEKTDIDALME